MKDISFANDLEFEPTLNDIEYNVVFLSNIKHFEDAFEGVFLLKFWRGYLQNEDRGQVLSKSQMLMCLVSSLVEDHFPVCLK